MWYRDIISFSGRSDLQFSILKTGRVCANCNSFLMDHSVPGVGGLSKKISLRVSSSLRHAISKCKNVLSSSSHKLQYLDTSMSILLWWYARKFSPVMALVSKVRFVLLRRNSPLDLEGSGLERSILFQCDVVLPSIGLPRR